MKMLRDDLELRRKQEIHEIEERKNSHINELMKKHERAFAGESHVHAGTHAEAGCIPVPDLASTRAARAACMPATSMAPLLHYLLTEIKNYYNDITHNNLDLIKTLKEDVAEMKKREAQVRLVM